jgi:hypothetical protein
MARSRNDKDFDDDDDFDVDDDFDDEIGEDDGEDALNIRGAEEDEVVDEEIDMPEDWNEEEILGELEEDLEVEEEEEDIIEDEGVEVAVASVATDEEEDEDEVDIEEIDLDEEEDEDEELLVMEESVRFAPDEDEEDGVEIDEPWDMAAVSEAVQWDAEDLAVYELQDDPDDPDYMQQKKIVEKALVGSQKRRADEEFDPVDFIVNKMTPEMEDELNESPFFKQVEEEAKDILLKEEDVKDLDLEKELETTADFMYDDPYPNEGQTDLIGTGLSDDDLDKLDKTFKMIHEEVQKEPWDKVTLRGLEDAENWSNETWNEIDDCLEEIEGSAYNVTKWLLYDLDFNVSNLILAAVKHNKEAPVLLQHWFPQLVTYKRYQHARDRDFDFTWEDVEQADISELERYYQGFGYDSIPKRAPAETGIIGFEEMDEEELKMLAFENWVTQVYNPEADRKDFDDDDMQDEDNVFSDFYQPPQHPDLPSFEDAAEDVELWQEEMGDDLTEEDKKYRDMMGQTFEYEAIHDEEFQKEFRGHLIIACTADDHDLEVAERITTRFGKEFGKQVYVETRVMAHAREDDNLFEIWLESYDVDLLHSKKRATSNAQDWDGPAEVDDEQLDYLTERVRFLVSDNARYSYRMEVDYAV